MPRDRVLVVDDYEDAAEVVCVLLDALGFDSVAAHSGRQALQIAAEFLPRIVMLDIALPDATGYELARAIRARPHGVETYLVAVTGLGSAKDRQTSLDAGFDRHVTKPLGLADLRLIMEEAVARLRRLPSES